MMNKVARMASSPLVVFAIVPGLIAWTVTAASIANYYA